MHGGQLIEYTVQYDYVEMDSPRYLILHSYHKDNWEKILFSPLCKVYFFKTKSQKTFGMPVFLCIKPCLPTFTGKQVQWWDFKCTGLSRCCSYSFKKENYDFNQKQWLISNKLI